ncbi:ankyrin [Rhizoclosmatium globosum]|uniref:Ankyrin n=1 Tax=Rhizoclosmatium globosum TaxID=329046 RepID=A0A1Y2CC98_9FUNG|nr:ankyrin [Rhizoclosmatium globosum]|eukprot:ORY44670.1 ankyrin [Rhizoclosmatium globosum]
MTGPYTEAELQAIADLIVAARNGHVDALKKTLATLEHVPTITHCILPDLEMEYVSPLAIAAEEGHEAIVDILLPSNKLDPSEDNAIAFAPKVDTFLFSRRYGTRFGQLWGADPSALNNEALRIVWERGQLDAAKMLVSTGKVDATYHDNEILLTYTALGHLDMVQYLVELPGIDPAVRDQKPLLLAVQGGFWDVVDFLLTSQLVLRVACALGHVEVVRVLLRDGRVDVNAQESYPFYVACEKGHVEVVEALFDTGKVRLHEQGMDALFVSVKSDHPEVVRYLLSIGAAPKDVLSRNDDLKVAVMNAGNEVIGIFREHENVLTQPFRPAVIGEANENKKPGTRGGILREDSVSTQTAQDQIAVALALDCLEAYHKTLVTY